jgi:hypothetical protein
LEWIEFWCANAVGLTHFPAWSTGAAVSREKESASEMIEVFIWLSLIGSNVVNGTRIVMAKQVIAKTEQVNG